MVYDAIIIGSGPAGLTAGLYTSRARLSTLILEKETMGGELMNRDMIENYPGYPGGVAGPELGSRMLQQAMSYGVEVKLGEVTGLAIKDGLTTVTTEMEEYRSKAVILAGGAHPKKLGVPGEEELSGMGVFYCATCDGPGFVGKRVAVIGGGDSGITEALFLAGFVSHVTVIEFMPHLTATKVLQERALANPKVATQCGKKVEAILGEGAVAGLKLRDVKAGKEDTLEVEGVLVHVGLEPNTAYLDGIVPMDKTRRVLVNERMATAVPGVFACGDIRANSPMQISTAIGDGATAAISLQKYITQG